jgi:hypothetical protein
MENILGVSNSILDYLLVLLIYFAVFILIRYPHPRIELNFKINFIVLFMFWSVAMFAGNYLFYLLGAMSFLPWLNNFIHTFLWVGFCLTFLYAGVYKHNIIEQFLLFAIFSFIIKVFENIILGTWEKDPYFFFHGKYAYIIIMSLVDGFYPIISVIVLKLSSMLIRGVYIEK